VQDDRSRILRQSHLGIQFVLLVGLSSWLGLKADERLGTSPAFTFLGALFGFGAGLYHLYVGVYGRPGKTPPGGDEAPKDPGPPPPSR
jgi:F0F1-type ATP synthase assembly protein I